VPRRIRQEVAAEVDLQAEERAEASVRLLLSDSSHSVSPDVRRRGRALQDSLLRDGLLWTEVRQEVLELVVPAV
jgi:hypothetical protein